MNVGVIRKDGKLFAHRIRGDGGIQLESAVASFAGTTKKSNVARLQATVTLGTLTGRVNVGP